MSDDAKVAATLIAIMIMLAAGGLVLPALLVGAVTLLGVGNMAYDRLWRQPRELAGLALRQASRPTADQPGERDDDICARLARRAGRNPAVVRRAVGHVRRLSPSETAAREAVRHLEGALERCQ